MPRKKRFRPPSRLSSTKTYAASSTADCKPESEASIDEEVSQTQELPGYCLVYGRDDDILPLRMEQFTDGDQLRARLAALKDDALRRSAGLVVHVFEGRPVRMTSSYIELGGQWLPLLSSVSDEQLLSEGLLVDFGGRSAQSQEQGDQPAKPGDELGDIELVEDVAMLKIVDDDVNSVADAE